jgi:hypothetical protein
MTIQTPTALYYARSATDPTRFYTVTRDTAGRLDCECPDRKYNRNKFCKHVRAIIHGEALPAQLKTAPADMVDDLWGDETAIDRALAARR